MVEVVSGGATSIGVVSTGAVIGVEVAVVVVVVEVTVCSETAASGISALFFETRCLLSHLATAVTPSCHDS